MMNTTKNLFPTRSMVATAMLLPALVYGLSGCVATKYQLASKRTPPLQILNVPFPAAEPLQSNFWGLVSYGGPGSWKRAALWDEYIIKLQNAGAQPVMIDSAVLSDPAGTLYSAGTDPWMLEKQSKALETRYRAGGQAFVRSAGMGLGIIGAGAVVGSAALPSMFVSGGAAGAAVATALVLPVYELSVLVINHHNKKAVKAEFMRRRLALPLTLAPGETRTGSVFFPMVRSPRSLDLHWSSGGVSGQATLPLDVLKGLHVPTITSKATP